MVVFYYGSIRVLSPTEIGLETIDGICAESIDTSIKAENEIDGYILKLITVD